MVEDSISGSESEAEENSDDSSSHAESGRDGRKEEGVSEYEKQRFLRIRENKARLDALGLPNLASSLLGSVGKQPRRAKDKGKRKKGAAKIREEDDEYQPSEREYGESSSSEESGEEIKKIGGKVSTDSRKSLIRKGKGKSPMSAARLEKTLPVQKDMNEFDLIDDNEALQQAIALSLGGPSVDLSTTSGGVSQNSGVKKIDVTLNGRKEGSGISDATGRRKRKKSNISRVQLTEDEVVAYFFSFDVAGKGNITARDLQRVAEAHDFNWTDSEIIDMIDCFDTDRDRKLSLEDFRTIVVRCKMLQGSENVE